MSINTKTIISTKIGSLHFTFFLVLLGDATSWAADRIELSVGIANPSPNGAITENPAALAKSSDRVFDFGLLVNSITTANALGSFASGSKGFGYGLKIQQYSTGFVPTLAIAVGPGSFSMGINAGIDLNNLTPTFGLGFRQELSSVTLGLMFNNLNTFGRDWTIGFSTTFAQFIRAALDFHFLNYSSSLGVSNATPLGTLEFYADQKFSVRFSYAVQIIPVLDTMNPGYSAGINVWVGKKNSLYVLYRTEGYDYTFGLKYFF